MTLTGYLRLLATSPTWKQNRPQVGGQIHHRASDCVCGPYRRVGQWPSPLPANRSRVFVCRPRHRSSSRSPKRSSLWAPSLGLVDSGPRKIWSRRRNQHFFYVLALRSRVAARVKSTVRIKCRMTAGHKRIPCDPSTMPREERYA